ncbi:MAG TPA: outer membrane beta-barrel protein [Gemmatimonadales bacterium]|nr:outer membrane beta-barrel protein [Gemmatimonadales bacterium]
MIRRVAWWCAALAALAVPAAAQQGPSFEAGVFARGTLFDPSLEVTGTAGLGARAGVLPGDRWLLEADFSASAVDGLAGIPETSYRSLHLRVNYLRPYSDRGQLVAGLGVVGNSYGGAWKETDAGITGLFGFRVKLARALVFRADGSLDYLPSPANRAGDNWIAAVQLGVGYRFGGS